MISKATRDKLIQQSLDEIAFARQHKSPKIKSWQLNENLLYQVKTDTADSRANVDLGRMAEFINSYLSKIDAPLKFKFKKQKESQLKRVQRLNALRDTDADRDFWDLKDLAGKEQLLLYGRMVFCYYADSANGYRPHLENVDVYDFLIDPSAGGLDMEKARFLGRYGVVKDRYDIKDSDMYISAEVKRLFAQSPSNTSVTQEDINKRNRQQINTTAALSETSDEDKFKFWEWFTTYQGERYYLLMTDGGIAIRVEKLTDMFPADDDFPLGAWPFWSCAARPSIAEFWTPAPADQVREIFMAQNVTVNQTIDNVEEHNKPMKVVDVNAIENMSELKYRKGGTIKKRGGMAIDQAVQFMRPSGIDVPLRLFEALEGIQEKASGVTASAKGISEDTKVGIYEGNQANTADRFGLINKSYAFAYKRFGQLYQINVQANLLKKEAIEILGPDGIETEQVSRRDLFKKGEKFGLMVEASDAEEQASETDKRNKIGFLGSNALNPIQNPKKAYEYGAKIVGFTTEEIKELLDTSEYGNAEILSECARDIEELLEGKPVKPNRSANLAYKQKFTDYLSDHEEDMTHEEFIRLATYLAACEQYVMANTVREMSARAANTPSVAAAPTQGGAPSPLPTPQPGNNQPIYGQI